MTCLQKTVYLILHIGNSPSSHGGSAGGLDPKLYDVPASMTSTTPKTTTVGDVTPNTTKWQNKMMPYDMLSGNNYPVGNMFSGYGGKYYYSVYFIKLS